MVMVVAYSFVINREVLIVILHWIFENSGSPEWFELVEGKTFQDFVTMDFENSGSPEWFGTCRR